jgi:hypothetical protein
MEEEGDERRRKCNKAVVVSVFLMIRQGSCLGTLQLAVPESGDDRSPDPTPFTC